MWNILAGVLSCDLHRGCGCKSDEAMNYENRPRTEIQPAALPFPPSRSLAVNERRKLHAKVHAVVALSCRKHEWFIMATHGPLLFTRAKQGRMKAGSKQLTKLQSLLNYLLAGTTGHLPSYFKKKAILLLKKISSMWEEQVAERILQNLKN